jgi:hypothetical protein
LNPIVLAAADDAKALRLKPTAAKYARGFMHA